MHRSREYCLKPEGFGPLQVRLGAPAASVLPEVPQEVVLSAFSWLWGESIVTFNPAAEQHQVYACKDL